MEELVEIREELEGFRGGGRGGRRVEESRGQVRETNERFGADFFGSLVGNEQGRIDDLLMLLLFSNPNLNGSHRGFPSLFHPLILPLPSRRLRKLLHPLPQPLPRALLPIQIHPPPFSHPLLFAPILLPKLQRLVNQPDLLPIEIHSVPLMNRLHELPYPSPLSKLPNQRDQILLDVDSYALEVEVRRTAFLQGSNEEGEREAEGLTLGFDGGRRRTVRSSESEPENFCSERVGGEGGGGSREGLFVERLESVEVVVGGRSSQTEVTTGEGEELVGSGRGGRRRRGRRRRKSGG